MEKLYTVEEIAYLTQVSTQTIRKMIKEGYIKGAKVGRKWVVQKSDYQNFLDNGWVKDTEKYKATFKGNNGGVNG